MAAMSVGAHKAANRLARPRPSWIRIDPASELADALALAVEFVERADSKHYAWKWVVLSVHTAVQFALVFASREDKWESTPEAGKNLRMRAFRTLLEGRKFELDDATLKAARRLNGLRDEFAHFKVDGWSLEVGFVKQTCVGCLPIIETLLMQNDRKVLFWPSRAAEQRDARVLRTLRKKLTS